MIINANYNPNILRFVNNLIFINDRKVNILIIIRNFAQEFRKQTI